MSDTFKYISIASIIISIVVAVYVFREMSNTRSKVGEIKFLKNTTVNIESRLLDIAKQLKKQNKYNIPDDSSTSSEEYDVLASSDDDEDDHSVIVKKDPVVKEPIDLDV